MTEEIAFLVLPLWIVTILCVATAFSLLGRQRIGPLLAIFTSVIWVVIGFIGRTLNNAQLTTVFLGIGIVWLAVSLIYQYLTISTQTTEVLS